MTRLSPLAFAAAIVATGVTVMAGTPGQAATAHVRYGDLDLSTVSGRATLDSRIDRAASATCRSENEYMHTIAACRRESVANAHAQVAKLIAGQTVQMASR